MKPNIQREPSSFGLRLAPWSSEQETLKSLRHQVFIVEQGVSTAEEWDGRDDESVHLIVESADGQAIGTGRLLPEGRIGRMAVLKEWRRRGVGAAIMKFFVRMAAEEGRESLVLDAQTHAIGFYEGFGFVAEGDIFMDAGIPHRRMWLGLASAPTYDDTSNEPR